MNDRIRILSANLWSGRADTGAFARQLEALAVDVCAVQELAADQARAIASVLPYGKLEPAADHRGMGIALRRPGDVRALEIGEGAARIVRLDPSQWPEIDRALELVNVHVRAPHALPPWRTLALRRRQLRGLLDYLDAQRPEPRALIGDFNATPLWPVYRQLAARLRDAAREHAAARGRAPRPTWGPWAGFPRLLRIDHAFVAEARALHVEVVGVAGSDHSGLLVDLAVDPA